VGGSSRPGSLQRARAAPTGGVPSGRGHPDERGAAACGREPAGRDEVLEAAVRRALGREITAAELASLAGRDAPAR